MKLRIPTKKRRRAADKLRGIQQTYLPNESTPNNPIGWVHGVSEVQKGKKGSENRLEQTGTQGATTSTWQDKANALCLIDPRRTEKQQEERMSIH